MWNISNAICRPLFEAILADFAKSVGAGATRRIVRQPDNTGRHGPRNLVAPEGIRLVFEPPHSPELKPAEHLRPSSTSLSPTAASPPSTPHQTALK